MIKTPPETERQIDRMFQRVKYRMVILYDRWQMEKKYEAFEDYVVEAKKEVDTMPGIQFINMSRRPFGFNFKVKGFHASYFFFVTAKQVGWRRKLYKGEQK